LSDEDRQSYRSRYEVEFAREIIASFKGSNAFELALEGDRLIKRREKEEGKAYSKALARLGVKWDSRFGLFDNVKVHTIDTLTAAAKISGFPRAGEKFYIDVKVKNKGKEPVEQLRARTESDNPFLSGLDLVFGKIKPGRSKRWRATVDLPFRIMAREDPVKISFFSKSGKVPAPVSINVSVKERIAPRIAYTFHIEDAGNGNGFFEQGEKLVIFVKVYNKGKGSTFISEANLSSVLGVDVESGHFALGTLAPGQSSEGRFVVRISKGSALKKAKVSFSVDEWVPAKVPYLNGLMTKEISIPVSSAKPSPTVATGTVLINSETSVPMYDSPLVQSAIVGYAKSGSVFKVDARYGGFFRIIFNKRHAWINEKVTVPGKSAAKFMVEEVLLKLPVINITGEKSRVINGESTVIKGSASHDRGIKDIIVYVGDKKVMYLGNSKKSKTMDFAIAVPVKKGANLVSIIARCDDKTVSSEVVFIRRK
jgi:carboxyl-terminal processing protease